jgi:lipopolysaccharide transport system ATP-binding protein
VYVGGVVAGLTRREVASRFDSIVASAELERFIHCPLRTYSSRMRMRLAFAVAAHTEQDVQLVDEVLAVGDRASQQKCLERIARFKLNGCAVVYVSHDLHTIPQLCDEAVWLHAGRAMAHGLPDVVIRQYQTDISTETRHWTPFVHAPAAPGHGSELRLNENRFGSLECEIVEVRLLDSAGLPVPEVGSGEPLRVELDYAWRDEIHAAVFGVTMLRKDNLVCYETTTFESGLTSSARGRCGRIALELQAFDLNSGQYLIDVGAYRADWAYAFDYHWRVYPLKVHSSDSTRGIVRFSHHWLADRVLP